MLDDARARELLKTLGTPKEIVDHSETVRRACLDLVEFLRDANPVIKVNKSLVSVGALLHDIGRTKTDGIDHGVVGAGIIRALNAGKDPRLEKVARICERHIGGGISRGEAKKLGLPEADYLPKTLEEKIVSYCDNMVDDAMGVPVVHDPSWAAIDYEKKHGKNSEPARRVRELNRFFERLLYR